VPNGAHGDHPITDLLIHGEHPFPTELEELVLKVHALNPDIIDSFPVWDWAKGKGVEQGIADLKVVLDRYPVEGFLCLDKLPSVKRHRHSLTYGCLGGLLTIFLAPWRLGG
jgi:hypothetical protein